MKNFQLKKLFAMLRASALFTVIANAQIIYTDVNPDSVISRYINNPLYNYNLDLNNDGVNDFTFGVYFSKLRYPDCGYTLSSEVYVSPADTSKDKVLIDSANLLPDNLPTDAVIDSSTNYWSSRNYQDLRDSGGYSCYGYKGIGNWIDSTEKYLGLKLIIGTNNYYGWARLSVTVTSTFAKLTVKDYAYNSKPNQPIRAGEKSCSSPTAKLNANGPLSFCAGDSVTLTAKGTGYLYQWKKNGKDISGATSQTYVAKNAGIYRCKVTNSCGTKTSKGDTVTISCKGLFNNAAGSDEKIISKTTQLNIAPNPISNSAVISFTIPQSQKVSIIIYDETGRLVKTLANTEMQAGTHQIVWNAKDEKGNILNAGMYFLRFSAGGYTEARKLVVVK